MPQTEPAFLDEEAMAEQIGQIEDRLEDLLEIAAGCRKAMMASKVLMIGGTLAILAAILGAFRENSIALFAGLASFIGGIVWFGANRSTLLQAQAKIRRFNEARAELIARLPMRTIH